MYEQTAHRTEIVMTLTPLTHRVVRSGVIVFAGDLQDCLAEIKARGGYIEQL
jgi:hypothetical protein